MQIKRIIPCLDIYNGRVVKGVQFKDLVDAGDPIEIAEKYNQLKADEIVFLDISATNEGRSSLLEVIKDAAKEVSIPLIIGGGIGTLLQFENAINAGASKVAINTAAVKNSKLISEAAQQFGTKRVVAAIDIKKVGADYKVFINGGNTNTGLDAIAWAQEVEQLGAGEILLTSMDCDGTKKGYDIDITSQVSHSVKIPVIASGGAGNMQHFLEVFTVGKASAALAAGLFHFNKVNIVELKKYLAANGIKVNL